ncbi:hypothetical protein DMW06_22230 [Vibrio parahaemolyticus]|nr:hypothetical protein [Vibrio parahaemolyticus]
MDDVGELSSCTSESPEKIVIREQISESIIKSLTEKELIIAKLSLNKKYQKEIAEELGVSVRTIFNYLKSIEDKSDEKWL